MDKDRLIIDIVFVLIALVLVFTIIYLKYF